MSELQEQLKNIYVDDQQGGAVKLSWDDGAIETIIKLIQAREQTLLASIRAELPKPRKQTIDSTKESTDRFYRDGGYNFALREVNAIITKYENKVAGGKEV